MDFLCKSKVHYGLEAHHALSAMLVEEAGFELIWASGLTISSALGHRDCNEISWTNFCDQLEYMADHTTIPILADGDTGFGNFNNVRMLIKKLEKINIQGVALEDKIFPKTNSFIEANQFLASIKEFQGKIRSAKDTQKKSSFKVIARTEAFIAGLGLEAALERAYAYEEAGADGIIVHSKKSTIEEIELFCKSWKGKAPLVVIPTKYPHTPKEKYAELGITLVIFANHLLRASMKSMKETARKIFEEKSVGSIEKEIASLDDIFTLVDEDELRIAEKKYLS